MYATNYAIRVILTPLLLRWVHFLLRTLVNFKRCETILGFFALFFTCSFTVEDVIELQKDEIQVSGSLNCSLRASETVSASKSVDHHSNHSSVAATPNEFAVEDVTELQKDVERFFLDQCFYIGWSSFKSWLWYRSFGTYSFWDDLLLRSILVPNQLIITWNMIVIRVHWNLLSLRWYLLLCWIIVLILWMRLMVLLHRVYVLLILVSKLKNKMVSEKFPEEEPWTTFNLCNHRLNCQQWIFFWKFIVHH